jgi:hypothetical protein
MSPILSGAAAGRGAFAVPESMVAHPVMSSMPKPVAIITAVDLMVTRVLLCGVISFRKDGAAA